MVELDKEMDNNYMDYNTDMELEEDMDKNTKMEDHKDKDKVPTGSLAPPAGGDVEGAPDVEEASLSLGFFSEGSMACLHFTKVKERMMYFYF